MLRTVLAAAVALALAATASGCDEEAPAPPNKPRVISADAVCRPVEGVPKLHQITVEVEDLDGVADLVPPLVLVEASALAMEAAPTDRASVDPETGEPADCLDVDGRCTMRYSWQREADSEQIYCGEGLDGLEVLFEVTDIAGFMDRRYIPTHPQ
jgi:hypothetical protein